ATPDGTCIRDYVHVSDLASAHVCALEALKAGRPSSAYNLGNGLGASVNEVIETAQRVTGLTIPVVRGEAAGGSAGADHGWHQGARGAWLDSRHHRLGPDHRHGLGLASAAVPCQPR